MKTGIYIGKVFHQRILPKNHFLKYKIYQFLIDLDHPPQNFLFGFNKANIFSFFEKDYGPIKGDNSNSLKTRIINQLAQSGLGAQDDRILLLTMPKILGFGFNPISIYFIFDKLGTQKAIIYEVNNTFGDRHSYICPNINPNKINPNQKDGEIKNHAAKKFHVSPFMGMDMEYDFRLKSQLEEFKILISLFQSGETTRQLMLTAGFQGKWHEFNSLELIKCLILMPFLTLGVVWGIHWQALKILIKGIKYHPKPHGKVSGTSIN